MAPKLDKRMSGVQVNAACAVPITVLLVVLLAILLYRMRRKRSLNYNAVPLDHSAKIKRWSRDTFSSSAPRLASTPRLPDIESMRRQDLSEQDTGVTRVPKASVSLGDGLLPQEVVDDSALLSEPRPTLDTRAGEPPMKSYPRDQ